MGTPSIIFIMLSTPHIHENIELGTAKHGAVHIPTKLRCNAYRHQTLLVPLGVHVSHFGKHCRAMHLLLLHLSGPQETVELDYQ